jgi:hypothetical protein
VQEANLAGKRYSLIYSALTKTATAGQGMALLESYIYTQNAYRDYWNTLDKNGQMVQVCDQAFLLARLFATAVAMLQEQGMSAQEAGRHIVLAADQQPGPLSFSPRCAENAFHLAANLLPCLTRGWSAASLCCGCRGAKLCPIWGHSRLWPADR